MKEKILKDDSSYRKIRHYVITRFDFYFLKSFANVLDTPNSLIAANKIK